MTPQGTHPLSIPIKTTSIPEPGVAQGSGHLSPEFRQDFAVVIPAFDEAPNVPDLIREVRAVFEQHQLSGDVILVDDGSRDGTADLAEAEVVDQATQLLDALLVGGFHVPPAEAVAEIGTPETLICPVPPDAAVQVRPT